MGQKQDTVQGVCHLLLPEQQAISIATRLYIWASRPKGPQLTSVYMVAKPVSGQMEANKGNSIGYVWWQQANGYNEYQTVRNYVALIQEYDRKKKAE